MIPRNFTQWRHCIENECDIALTAAFIRQRLQILQDAQHQETRRFATLYGEAHLRQVIIWYQQASAMTNA